MSTESPWNAPPEDFIDPLVSVLKRTRRWSRDGRSLRALNRHWCAALTRHVVEVKPHGSRELGVEDIRSLSKFQKLTVLDAIPFEGSGEDVEGRCCLLEQTLCHLPHLTQLDVHSLCDNLEDHNCQFLPTINSIHFRGNQITKRQLSKIRASKIQKLAGNFRTEDFVNPLWLPTTLKTLNVTWFSKYLTEHFEQFVSSTARLEALSIRYNSEFMLQNVSKLQNLVALEAYGQLEAGSLEPLLDLPKLTSLKLTCVNREILEDPVLKILTGRLVSLELCSIRYSSLIIDRIDWMTLKRLTLRGFILNKRNLEVLGTCPSLSLSLLGCSFDADTSNISELLSVKRLYSEEKYSRYSFPKRLLSSMKSLERLSLCLQHTSLDTELLSKIHTLKNLVFLSLQPIFNRRQRCSFPLEGIKSLVVLPHLLSFCVYTPPSLEVVEELMNMELCTKVEKLSFMVSIPIDETAVQRCAKALKRKAPYLKLALGFEMDVLRCFKMCTID